MGRGGSRVVPGGLRPGLSPARLRARVAQATRGETAEDRAGQRHLLLAPPQLHHQLHDRTVEELAYPLLLAAQGVAPWLLTIGFGHSDMYWYRLIERLGRNSLVGTTVRDATQLPAHLAADEHHADWAGQKGYVATTVGGGCVLGVALTASADDAHLQEAT